jgi:hypothetical protein
LKSLTVLVVSVLLLCGCSTKTDEEKYQDIEKALTGSIGDLTGMPTRTELTDPYIHGKIAVFQALESNAAYAKGVYFMQPLYYRELQDNYATKPEEVGTVALVNCKTTQKGVYKSEDGQEHPAMVEDCGLTLIDRSKDAVVYKKTFAATPSQKAMVIANSVSKGSGPPGVTTPGDLIERGNSLQTDLTSG